MKYYTAHQSKWITDQSKEWITDTCNNMGKYPMQHVAWKKTQRAPYCTIPFMSYSGKDKPAVRGQISGKRQGVGWGKGVHYTWAWDNFQDC